MQTKLCSHCNSLKNVNEYNKRNDDIRAECKACEALRRKRYRKRYPEKELLSKARMRAKKYGLQIDITVDDILIPKLCPVLGIKLRQNNKIASDNSPSLDRINPNKGYIKGNIRVISFRANSLKSNASIKELEAILNDARKFPKGKNNER
jgi:hypothetical protein